jgi:hypothetical protein
MASGSRRPSRGAVVTVVALSGGALVGILLLSWSALTTPGPGETCDELVSAGCQVWDSLTMMVAAGLPGIAWLAASGIALFGRPRWPAAAAWGAAAGPLVVVAVAAAWLALELPV